LSLYTLYVSVCAINLFKKIKEGKEVSSEPFSSVLPAILFILCLFFALSLILPNWRIWRAPNNASKWQMGFNSVFSCCDFLFIIMAASVFYLYCRPCFSLNCSEPSVVLGVKAYLTEVSAKLAVVLSLCLHSYSILFKF